MPIALIQQPSGILPNAKSFPIRWVFLTNEHVLAVGSKAFFEINFQSSGSPNFEQVQIKGITFEVNNATPYTQTTFQTTGTTRDVAFNFVGMLRKNIEFKDFVFSIVQSLSPLGWVVRAESVESKVQSVWTFDVSGLSLITTLDSANGEEAQTRQFKIWYQVFNDAGPITENRFSDIPFLPDFPFISVVRIDTTNRLAALLSSSIPDIYQFAPAVDALFTSSVYLKFGGVEFDINCNKIFQETYETAKFTIANAVCQLEETNLLAPFAPNGNREIRFLTSRKKSRAICGDSYEWIHIWIEATPVKYPPFIVRTRYYDKDNNILFTDQQTIDYNDKGHRRVYVLAIGTSNRRIKSLKPVGTVWYDVQVVCERLNADGITTAEVAYSELIERRLVSCNCKVAEMYFVEDKGSWQTVTFEHLQQRAIIQQTDSFERDLEYSVRNALFGKLYLEGGQYEKASEAEKTFTVQTERITEGNRKMYEELLRSPYILLRTISDYGEVIRRVLFNRQNESLFDRGEATRLNLTFRFSTKLNTQ